MISNKIKIPVLEHIIAIICTYIVLNYIIDNKTKKFFAQFRIKMYLNY